MSYSENLDDCKKEIRSILITHQKGCYLSEFQREYKSLIGRRLPIADFGYKSDIEFLYSMPDVVQITPCANKLFHLQGIADETVKHIQKMVAKQKPTKLKGPPPPRYSRPSRFNLPPRFIVPHIKNVPEFKLPQKTVMNEPKLPSKETLNTETQLTTKLSPKEEVILLIQKHKNRLALDDLLVEYKRMYNKHLSLSTYGLSSIEECINFIPELHIVRKNNVDFIVYHSELENISDNEVQNSWEVSSGLNTTRIPTSEVQSSFNSDNIRDDRHLGLNTTRIPSPEVQSSFNWDNTRDESHYEGNVPTSLRKKFQMVADRFPNGICASEFPDYFKEVTSESLDFPGLGFRCLGDLIDDVPDIFTRRSVAGSRKDYIIYPAKSTVDSSFFVDHIILNLRKILEGYPEGIKMKDILHVYSINCKDALHIEDLGFDHLESFLTSIKNSIPLTFGLIDGEKSVHLKPSCTTETLYRIPANIPQAHKDETIPFDALIPEFVKFKPLTLPLDFDYEKFVPVYVSAVAHPGHLYIQFHAGEDAENGFEEVSKEMESFYHSSQSEFYIVKNMHVKQGACCVAKWPTDNHWYRSQILSMPSVDTVKVLYIDYGTSDTIPRHLLRYAKKKFIDLPVQALKCSLAYLRPPKNAEKWDLRARNRILSLCQDIPLMAKIEIQSGGNYSVILCDTNGETDVFINDVLCEERFAEHDSSITEENASVPSEPNTQMDYNHNLNIVQALQAQYHLKVFAALAPSFAQNEHYLILLQQISMYCQPTGPQNIGMPSMPPGFNSVLPNLNACGQTNSNALGSIYPVGPTLEGSSIISRVNAPTGNVSIADYFVNAPVQRDLPQVFSKPTENATLGNGEADNEIFDDDDDELFQEFCLSKHSSNIRHVKRVILGDGYKIHIIVVESTPYASSGDISHLIWNNKDADYLFRRLELEQKNIPFITLSEDGNEELFQQLTRFKVKGVQKIIGFKSSILLYSLKDVIKILNIFGHPSVTLRARLTEEIVTFNPNDPYWQDFSPDVTEVEDEGRVTGVTDDDKIGRLCRYDLLAMKESLMWKKKKILNNQNNSQSDEIHKLESLHNRVLQRIQEIDMICEIYQ